LWLGPKTDSTEADSLPSILPCSQSTITQSGPALARTLETLAPGSICQRPMAGRVASAKTCFNRFDRNMIGSVYTDTKRTRRWIRCIDVDFRCGDSYNVTLRREAGHDGGWLSRGSFGCRSPAIYPCRSTPTPTLSGQCRHSTSRPSY
jgi:hypothetical protein